MKRMPLKNTVSASVCLFSCMKATRIITAIDIGSSLIKVMVLRCGEGADAALPHIIGFGQAEARGIEQGYVVSENDAVRAVRNALAEAEKSAKVHITEAYLAVGGIMLDAHYAHGETTASGPDQIINDADIERAVAYGTESMRETLINTHILHEIPLRVALDGKKVFGKAVGMRGNKLDVDTLVISALEQQYDGLIRVAHQAGVRVVDTIAAPIAASIVSLTKVHKKMGAMMIDIGAETTSVTIFEESHPVALAVFPMGSLTLTEDIALEFRISIEEAEMLKRRGVQHTAHPKKKLDAVIAARYNVLFTTIRDHFKKKKFTNILPAGAFLHGGGALQPIAVEIARDILGLPARIVPSPFDKNTRMPHELMMTVYGVCTWAIDRAAEESGITPPQKIKKTIMWWIKQFIP